MARRWGIVPWPEGEAVRAAEACFRAWLENRGGGEPMELIEGLSKVRQFLEEHGNDRFERAWSVRYDREGTRSPSAW